MTVGFIGNLFESVVSLGGSSPSTPKADTEVLESFEGVNVQKIVDFIREIKDLSYSRRDIIEDIDAMLRDSVVGSAVELITEDATQLDKTRMHVCWVQPVQDEVESVKQGKAGKTVGKGTGKAAGKVENLTTSADDAVKSTAPLIDVLEDFLYNILDIDEMLYPMVYNIVAYGECFVRTYDADIAAAEGKRPDERNPMEEKLLEKRGKYYEIVQDPLTVSAIMQYGDVVGFLHSPENRLNPDNNLSGTSVTGNHKPPVLYNTREYIHVANDRGVKRETVVVKLPDGKGGTLDQEFQVQHGTSFIETAREAYETLALIELIMLISRFNKSAFYRLFKIEVGGSTRKEIIRMLREFKTNLSQAETISLPKGKYNSKESPIPYGGNLYIPVKNGKGDVTTEAVGGDMDFHTLFDIDYYQSKLFASLRTPKAFLGLDEAAAGGIGNSSLTRQDARYARMIKRAVACAVRLVKGMCDYYLYTLGRGDECGLYAVHMPPIITVEDTDKAEIANSQLGIISTIMTLLAEVESVDKKNILTKLLMMMLEMDIDWEEMLRDVGGSNKESSSKPESKGW